MPRLDGDVPLQSDTNNALRKLGEALQGLVNEPDAFQNEIAFDLGKHTFGRQVGLSREGLQLAHDGVKARMRHVDEARGCIPSACAIFDGLRIARRGAALTLIESQDATVLTATGMEALKELCRQVEACISMAQREIGAAECLKNAVDTLRASGLEGVENMVALLEKATKVAKGITHDLEDQHAIAVAGRMRKLEVEVRPLVDATDPLLSKPWDKVDGEILWETRMVNVSDVVKDVLREVRAEVGGWAICADVATELRKCTDAASASVADAFDAASKMLRDEGLQKCGAESLRVVRQAIAAPGTSSLPEATVLLLRDAPRWLREVVGAAAVLREAAAHRILECGSATLGTASAAESAAKVQRALEAAARHLADVSKDAELQGRGSCIAAAAAEFRRAVALAREHDSLCKILNEVDKDVAHLLGVAWSAEPTTFQLAASTVDVEDVELKARPRGTDEEAAVDSEARKPKGGGCCTVM